MAPAATLLVLQLAAALALVMIGAVGAWAAGNALKRVAGVLIAFIGAIVALAALGAAGALLAAALAMAFAFLACGLALTVRLQEAYGDVETPEIDAADEAADAAERGA